MPDRLWTYPVLCDHLWHLCELLVNLFLPVSVQPHRRIVSDQQLHV